MLLEKKNSGIPSMIACTKIYTFSETYLMEKGQSPLSLNIFNNKFIKKKLLLEKIVFEKIFKKFTASPTTDFYNYCLLLSSQSLPSFYTVGALILQQQRVFPAAAAVQRHD